MTSLASLLTDKGSDIGGVTATKGPGRYAVDIAGRVTVASSAVGSLRVGDRVMVRSGVIVARLGQSEDAVPVDIQVPA